MKDDKGEKNRKSEKNGGPKFKWDEMVMGAFDKLASGTSKLKDPSQALEWVKGLRDDLQEKIGSEISEKLTAIDMESLAKKVGEHLAEHYDVELSAKISLKPKGRKKSDDGKPEDSKS